MRSPSPLAGEGGARRRASGDGRVRELRKLLRQRAREMRQNPTDAEKRLWSMLRDRRMPAFKFRRQFVIDPYIVDFVCFERRMIVEADGSQHAENERDVRRDAFDAIYAALTAPHPPIAAQWVPPSPARGEGLRGAPNG